MGTEAGKDKRKKHHHHDSSCLCLPLVRSFHSLMGHEVKRERERENGSEEHKCKESCNPWSNDSLLLVRENVMKKSGGGEKAERTIQICSDPIVRRKQHISFLLTGTRIYDRHICVILSKTAGRRKRRVTTKDVDDGSRQ